jgi:hypothetical protein
MGSWVRKVNHSSDPSAKFRVMKISGWWRQILIAIQDIAHNSEVTAFCRRGFLQGKECLCDLCIRRSTFRGRVPVLNLSVRRGHQAVGYHIVWNWTYFPWCNSLTTSPIIVKDDPNKIVCQSDLWRVQTGAEVWFQTPSLHRLSLHLSEIAAFILEGELETEQG